MGQEDGRIILKKMTCNALPNFTKFSEIGDTQLYQLRKLLPHPPFQPSMTFLLANWPLIHRSAPAPQEPFIIIPEQEKTTIPRISYIPNFYILSSYPFIPSIPGCVSSQYPPAAGQ